MNTLSARRPVIAPAAGFNWLGLAETSLRVLLIVAAPVCAVIFVAQSV
jgi:hypothetical protein